MTGFVKIRLFSNFRGSVLPKIKLDYFVSNHNIEDSKYFQRNANAFYIMEKCLPYVTLQVLLLEFAILNKKGSIDSSIIDRSIISSIHPSINPPFIKMYSSIILHFLSMIIVVEAPNWNITAQSRSASFIKVTWPYYKPTNKDKSQNLNQVVKYVPVCVMKKNGRIFTTHHSVFSRNTNSGFRNLKYGEYTVYLLAYLGDSRNTPLTNWKKAARKSRSITLKTREGSKYGRLIMVIFP